MKVYQNGIYRDMTPSEIEEYNRLQQEQPPEQPPTIDQRVSGLEETLNIILGGVQDA